MAWHGCHNWGVFWKLEDNFCRNLHKSKSTFLFFGGVASIDKKQSWRVLTSISWISVSIESNLKPFKLQRLVSRLSLFRSQAAFWDQFARGLWPKSQGMGWRECIPKLRPIWERLKRGGGGGVVWGRLYYVLWNGFVWEDVFLMFISVMFFWDVKWVLLAVPRSTCTNGQEIGLWWWDEVKPQKQRIFGGITGTVEPVDRLVTNISFSQPALPKMIFLSPKMDMLVPSRVYPVIYRVL